MGTSSGNEKSIVDLLLADHQAAKKLFESTHGATDLGDRFCEMVPVLVGHEVAEEEIVYPAFRRAGGTDGVADARIGEQQEAEVLLKEMEHMDTSSAEFKQSLTKLESAVLQHAEKEEQEVFPKLRSSFDEDELRNLGKQYEMAKAVAPTHPHPHAPNQPPGNLVLGPIAAIADRVRDAARAALAKAH